MKCIKCNRESLSENSNYCPYCGAAQKPVFTVTFPEKNNFSQSKCYVYDSTTNKTLRICEFKGTAVLPYIKDLSIKVSAGGYRGKPVIKTSPGKVYNLVGDYSGKLVFVEEGKENAK